MADDPKTASSGATPAPAANAAAGGQTPAAEAGPNVITEEQMKVIRGLPFYQRDIAAAQKALQTRLNDIEKENKRLLGIEAIANLDEDTRATYSQIGAITEHARANYLRDHVPEHVLAKAKTPDEIRIVGDAFLAGMAQSASVSAEAAAAVAAATKGAGPESWADMSKGGRAGTTRKTHAELADGEWDPKGMNAELKSLGVNS